MLPGEATRAALELVKALIEAERVPQLAATPQNAEAVAAFISTVHKKLYEYLLSVD
jgi:hypothetical protein